MKKVALLLVLIFSLSLISCSSGKSDKATTEITTKNYSYDDEENTTEYEDDEVFEVTTKSKNSYTVYITETGTKYHKKSCSYLRKTCIEIDHNEAIGEGYRPCSRCNP